MKIKQTSEKFKKVVLIGVGMMGGSFTRDLLQRKLARCVVGLDQSQQAQLSGLKVGAITEIEKNIAKALSGADLIIVATPVLATGDVLKKIAPHVNAKALIIDLGSTKKNVVTLGESFFPKGNFIGCHPMAGTEKSGVIKSQTGLFCDKICFLVPGKTASPFFLRKAQKLWQNLGAKVLFLTGNEHDHQLAYTSHLPHVAAYALVRSVAGAVSRRGFQTQVGGGFKDTTRIAASDAKMWRDIFLDNQKEVLAAMTHFEAEWKKIKTAIQNRRADAIESYIEKAAGFRRRLT